VRLIGPLPPPASPLPLERFLFFGDRVEAHRAGRGGRGSVQSFGTTTIDAWPTQPATVARITAAPTLLGAHACRTVHEARVHGRDLVYSRQQSVFGSFEDSSSISCPTRIESTGGITTTSYVFGSGPPCNRPNDQDGGSGW